MTTGETSLVPNVPGVYAFFYHTRCVYIGESGNLGRRISQHEYRGWLDLPGTRLLCFPDDDRKRTEQTLIEEWTPLLNGKPSCKAFAALKEAQGCPVDWAPCCFRKETEEERELRGAAMREYLAEIGLI
jgi:hypothetical protein